MDPILEKQLPVAIHDYNSHRLPTLKTLVGTSISKNTCMEVFLHALKQHILAVDPNYETTNIFPVIIFDSDYTVLNVSVYDVSPKVQPQ
jgi:hypothetical protein